LDPPESRTLLRLGAKVAFNFPQVWLLYPLRLGRFMHVMLEISRLLPQLALSSIDRFPLAKVTQARDGLARTDASVVVIVRNK
jgi:hypothetical protein